MVNFFFLIGCSLIQRAPISAMLARQEWFQAILLLVSNRTALIVPCFFQRRGVARCDAKAARKLPRLGRLLEIFRDKCGRMTRNVHAKAFRSLSGFDRFCGYGPLEDAQLHQRGRKFGY